MYRRFASFLCPCRCSSTLVRLLSSHSLNFFFWFLAREKNLFECCKFSLIFEWNARWFIGKKLKRAIDDVRLKGKLHSFQGKMRSFWRQKSKWAACWKRKMNENIDLFFRARKSPLFKQKTRAAKSWKVALCECCFHYVFTPPTRRVTSSSLLYVRQTFFSPFFLLLPAPDGSLIEAGSECSSRYLGRLTAHE